MLIYKSLPATAVYGIVGEAPGSSNRNISTVRREHRTTDRPVFGKVGGRHLDGLPQGAAILGDHGVVVLVVAPIDQQFLPGLEHWTGSVDRGEAPSDGRLDKLQTPDELAPLGLQQENLATVGYPRAIPHAAEIPFVGLAVDERLSRAKGISRGFSVNTPRSPSMFKAGKQAIAVRRPADKGDSARGWGRSKNSVGERDVSAVIACRINCYGTTAKEEESVGKNDLVEGANEND